MQQFPRYLLLQFPRYLLLLQMMNIVKTAGVQVCVEFKLMNMEKLSAYAQNLPQEAKQ